MSDRPIFIGLENPQASESATDTVTLISVSLGQDDDRMLNTLLQAPSIQEYAGMIAESQVLPETRSLKEML